MKRIHWTLYFLGWTLGISALGALIGAISFPVLGAFLGWKFTSWELIKNGARNLGFLFFVWAVPIAAIAAVIRAHHKKAKSL